jgi:hypothetical protein
VLVLADGCWIVGEKELPLALRVAEERRPLTWLEVVRRTTACQDVVFDLRTGA